MPAWCLDEQAVTDGMLWAMDRGTFRTIVLASRVQQRARFEKVVSYRPWSFLLPTWRWGKLRHPCMETASWMILTSMAHMGCA